MIRTRIAQATTVIALALGTAALVPSAAVAAEPVPSFAPVVGATPASAPTVLETGTWGG
ncbi:hypothetical protein [Streptomyces roseicoloratus]|nr:hypothetical protein [Streptomyces roseicoloratus]